MDWQWGNCSRMGGKAPAFGVRCFAAGPSHAHQQQTGVGVGQQTCGNKRLQGCVGARKPTKRLMRKSEWHLLREVLRWTRRTREARNKSYADSIHELGRAESEVCLRMWSICCGTGMASMGHDHDHEAPVLSSAAQASTERRTFCSRRMACSLGRC